MTYDPVATLARFAAQRDMKIALLADEGSALIKGFGVLNEAYSPGSSWHGVAHPTTVLVAPDGTVVRTWAPADYDSERFLEEVLTALREKPAS